MKEQEIIIKIAIVEDDIITASLLKSFFKITQNIEVLYTANSGNQFLEKLREEKILPDIVLLDLRMKNGTGIDVLEKLSIEKQEIKTIIISSHYKASYTGQMLKLGCDAFLPKEIEPEELVEVIYEVYEKGHYFLQEQIESLRKQVATKSHKLFLDSKEGLSLRELEVLEMLCQQLTAKEIADKMFVSSKTIEAHKSNLLIKTGVKNSAGLIIYAIQNKLVNPDDLILLS